MSEELEKLERDVERELVLLRQLPPALPSRASVERAQARVVAEAARRARRWRWIGAPRVWAGVAAAAVLAIGWWSWPRGTVSRMSADADAELAAWAVAFDASSASLSEVVEFGWASTAGATDADVELDGLIRGLDESLARFDEL